MNLDNVDGQWLISKEWYTDPFADSLNTDNIKVDEFKQYLLNSSPDILLNFVLSLRKLFSYFVTILQLTFLYSAFFQKTLAFCIHYIKQITIVCCKKNCKLTRNEQSSNLYLFLQFQVYFIKKNILRQPTKNKIFHIVLITEKSLKT